MITNKHLLVNLLKSKIIEFHKTFQNSLVDTPKLKCYLLTDECEAYYIYDSEYKIKIFLNKSKLKSCIDYFPTNYLSNLENCTILIKSYYIDFTFNNCNDDLFDFEVVLLVEDFVIDVSQKRNLKTSIKHLIDINFNHEIEIAKQNFYVEASLNEISKRKQDGANLGVVELFSFSTDRNFFFCKASSNYNIGVFKITLCEFDGCEVFKFENENLHEIASDEIKKEATDEEFLKQKRTIEEESQAKIQLNKSCKVLKKDFLSVYQYLSKYNL